jgi:ketosteroid isomerase-like protein
MSQANVEVVRRMFEHWNAGDVEAWLRCWHTDAEWSSEPFKALEGRARTYRGHAELRRFPVDVLEGFADLGQVEELRFRDVGDSVVVLAEYRVRAGTSGPEISTPMAWLVEVRDGKAARGRDFRDQRKALEAAGLSE